MDKNELYYGDNLQIMRDHLASDSIDLIYLDPPFNSQATYNVLYKSPKGIDSEAQVAAFEDTWKWSEAAEICFDELLSSGDTGMSEMIRAFRQFMGESDMMAYLSFMAIRILEFRRVLKDTGSIYLHCDPTASHYLKLLMDTVFGSSNFRNEIAWKRTNAHNMNANYYQKVRDIIFFYSISGKYVWNQPFGNYSPEQLKRYKEDEDGRLYTGQDLTMISKTKSRKFEWRGMRPPENRGWALSREKLEELLEKGLILKRRDGKPRFDGLKVFLDDMPGKRITDLWDDIGRIGNTSSERLGYATQKPQALLERIIEASSNAGDVVLDPFCGCGTTVAAAQNLDRKWIGIDITHIAINLMELRINSAFPKAEFEVNGIPKEIAAAHDLAERDRFEFQYWACSLVNAHPFDNKKKGADHGVDGIIYFKPDGKTDAPAIVSVKSGKNINVGMIRDLIGTMESQNAQMGIFVTLFPPTRPMKKLAVSSGFLESPIGKHPRVQILTIGELLSGNQRPDIPYVNMLNTFRKAPLVRKTKVQEQLFDSDE